MHFAAQYGDEGVITLLHSFNVDIDVNQADNKGITPIVITETLQHDSPVTFLWGLGASMPTDDMELKTVDDVVDF